MEVVFEKLFANMTSISQAEQDEDIKPFDADPWAQQLDFNGRSISNNTNLRPKIRWSKSMWVIKHIQSLSL